MREIKFRAWDGERWTYYTIGIDGDGFVYLPPLPAPGKPFKKIVQYTGLEDRRNKDIYFGDLVSDEEGYIGKIVKGKYGVIILWLNEDGDWDEVEKPEEYFEPTVSIEVIGNIYENPELLN